MHTHPPLFTGLASEVLAVHVEGDEALRCELDAERVDDVGNAKFNHNFGLFLAPLRGSTLASSIRPTLFEPALVPNGE
jgi:hypothetical protein